MRISVEYPKRQTMNDAGSTQDPEETTWLLACRRGDRQAFRPLVERYQNRVFAIALRMLGSRAAAEDAAQEAFVRAYTALHRYDPKRRFSTWLCRIVVNLCIDEQRRGRGAPEASLDPQQGAEPGASLEREEARAAVQAALGQLPVAYRTVLVLKDIEGRDYKSIRDILGGSLPALKIRVVRGRAKLAELLRQMYPGRF